MRKLEKALLFYNPAAGNGYFKGNLDRVIERFQKKGVMVAPVRADRRLSLHSLLRRTPWNEGDRIIAAGGDGTASAVANAMMAAGLDLPLAVFPTGTANDFAYCLGLPQKLDEMIDVALEGNVSAIDVGRANGRHFINVLAMGMMVDVSQKTDPNIKSTLGVISYYIRGFSELPNLRPIRVRVTAGEFRLEENIFFMLVMNGVSAGGFRRLAPKAEIGDGLLDVLIFKEMPIMEMAPLLMNVLAGQHEGNRNVICFKARSARVESDMPLGSDMDGEAGPPLPLDVSIAPQKLRVMTPREWTAGALWQ
jgi:YegS/Rv2252/BmrU family lipid kinase